MIQPTTSEEVNPTIKPHNHSPKVLKPCPNPRLLINIGSLQKTLSLWKKVPEVRFSDNTFLNTQIGMKSRWRGNEVIYRGNLRNKGENNGILIFKFIGHVYNVIGDNSTYKIKVNNSLNDTHINS